MGGPSFDLPWPPARNPWNPEHFTAGSSSGTGAAVAAGLMLGGTGSDTGGSIRGPARYAASPGSSRPMGCVSRRGVLPLSFSAGSYRPDGLDGARIARCCCRRWPGTIRRSGQRRPSGGGFLGRSGQGREGPADRRDPAFPRSRQPGQPGDTAGHRATRWIFSANRARRSRDVTLSPLMDYNAPGWLILITEGGTVTNRGLQQPLQRLRRTLRDRLALGRPVRGSEYVQALRRRRDLCVETARRWRTSTS